MYTSLPPPTALFRSEKSVHTRRIVPYGFKTNQTPHRTAPHRNFLKKKQNPRRTEPHLSTPKKQKHLLKCGFAPHMEARLFLPVFTAPHRTVPCDSHPPPPLCPPFFFAIDGFIRRYPRLVLDVLRRSEKDGFQRTPSGTRGLEPGAGAESGASVSAAAAEGARVGEVCHPYPFQPSAN